MEQPPPDGALAGSPYPPIADHDLNLRYKVDESDDGLRGEKGTFAICTWWLVSALAEIGDLDRARQLRKKMLAYASPQMLAATPSPGKVAPRPGAHGEVFRGGDEA